MLSDEEALKLVHSFGQHTPEQLEMARTIATAAIEIYGDLEPEEWKRFRANGIWNDHAAVQAALAAIKSAASNAAEAERKDVVAEIRTQSQREFRAAHSLINSEDAGDKAIYEACFSAGSVLERCAQTIERGDHTPSAEEM